MLGLIRVSPPYYIPIENEFGVSYLQNELLNPSSGLLRLIEDLLGWVDQVAVVIPKSWAIKLKKTNFSVDYKVKFVGVPDLHSITYLISVFDKLDYWGPAIFCDTGYKLNELNELNEFVNFVKKQEAAKGVFLDTYNFLNPCNDRKRVLNENLKSVAFSPFHDPGFVSESGKLVKWTGRAFIQPMEFIGSLYLPDQPLDFTQSVSSWAEFDAQKRYQKGDLSNLFKEPVYLSEPLNLVISPNYSTELRYESFLTNLNNN